VVVSALLGAALVPGPVLAAVSGILFGAVLGTVVTIAASVLGAVVALLLARHGAGRQFAEVSGPRMQALTRLAERHGVVAVIVQRLIPGVPDAPASYLFGLLGVRVWQIALGTAIGASPRAFSYTAVGASLDDPSSIADLRGHRRHHRHRHRRPARRSGPAAHEEAVAPSGARTPPPLRPCPPRWRASGRRG
jgi:uncharacterized membrane protein YdjX (TVP38/TMEM64 family)